jgi:hypothetical protein
MVAFLLKILAMLPKGITDRFAADKIMHFIVGAAIGLVGLFVYGPLGAIGWAFMAGILKEIYDYLMNERALKAGLAPPHGVELKDAIATTLGGVLVAAIAVAIGLVI